MSYILEFDTYLLNLIYKLRNPVLDIVMPGLTSLANGGFIWILICLVCIFIKRTKKCGIVTAVSLIFNFCVCNLFLKKIVARSRPFSQNTMVEILIKLPKDYSFPSGHTSASFAAATAIFLHNKKWGSVAYVLATLIAFSRLYLYVHYPTDVICGALIGIVCALVANVLVKKKVHK